MSVRSRKLGLAVVVTQLGVLLTMVRAQEKPNEEPPPVPKGIEVLARGPVHEAFASLAGEPVPTQPVDKKPPKPLEEMPPAEKPDGDVVWIGGYWAWDDDRKDFLWVSGVWRTPPPRKQWVAGYWREEGEQWQWVPGFWTDAAAEEGAKQVTYLPKPPEQPEVAPPGRAPVADAFYVPGAWIWNPVTGTYAWRAGYWARVQPGYVWIPDHYRWTPTGYIFIPGYWDLAVSRRGVLYAPVVVDPLVVTAGFTYTPVYAVSDAVVVDALFVRPAYAHYYFGDYYGPAYATLGYESVIVSSGRRYDSIIVYETWAHRSQPNWVSLQIDIHNGRSRGELPVPPRTLVQQNTIIQQNITNVTNVTNNITNNVSSNATTVNRSTTYNTPVLAPTTQVAAAKGLKTVPLDSATRVQARDQAAVVQQVAQQRTATEQPLPPGAPRQARAASLSVPKTQSVQPGFTAPKLAPQALARAASAQPPQPAPAPRPGLARPTSSVGHPGIPASTAHLSSAAPPGRPATGITASQPGRPVSPLPQGLRPGGPGAGLAVPHAQPAQPQRTMPGSPPRPLGGASQPPARRPPPKDSKEHH
jgi:hypothetical protein